MARNGVDAGGSGWFSGRGGAGVGGAVPHTSGGLRASGAGTKARKGYATPCGDCAGLPGSRKVTLIYPRLTVVHP